MINQRNWASLKKSFLNAEPFNHIVIDDFFTADVAESIAGEFPDYESTPWRAQWNNPIENKRLHNVWDLFGPTTYRAFAYLLSQDWVNKLEAIVGNKNVYGDVGLNGGGLHSHTSGGHLNVHLDYNIHPKLKLKRNYNLIVYMTPEWDAAWGGGLGLWSHNANSNQPDQLIKTVDAKFNRAVIFNTAQNSWHGLPEPITCPQGVCRNSMAIYYLTQPTEQEDPRGKALFAPYGEQANDPAVLDLIKKRADVNQVKSLYKDESNKTN
jgi:Rps23 Pro-64 3,4-dihydroxylase Tpa1-like proline 4-hydroxylase